VCAFKEGLHKSNESIFSKYNYLLSITSKEKNKGYADKEFTTWYREKICAVKSSLYNHVEFTITYMIIRLGNYGHHRCQQLLSQK
jgi:hypothetical protein